MSGLNGHKCFTSLLFPLSQMHPLYVLLTSLVFVLSQVEYLYLILITYTQMPLGQIFYYSLLIQALIFLIIQALM